MNINKSKMHHYQMAQTLSVTQDAGIENPGDASWGFATALAASLAMMHLEAAGCEILWVGDDGEFVFVVFRWPVWAGTRNME